MDYLLAISFKSRRLHESIDLKKRIICTLCFSKWWYAPLKFVCVDLPTNKDKHSTVFYDHNIKLLQPGGATLWEPRHYQRGCFWQF